MESTFQTVLLLVNPNDIMERENLTHNMREKKHVVDVLAHCSNPKSLFLSQQSHLVIFLPMRCPLIYKSMV